MRSNNGEKVRAESEEMNLNFWLNSLLRSLEPLQNFPAYCKVVAIPQDDLWDVYLQSFFGRAGVTSVCVFVVLLAVMFLVVCAINKDSSD